MIGRLGRWMSIGGWDIEHRVIAAVALPAIVIAIALVWYFTQTRIGDLDRALAERGLAVAHQLAPASEYGVFSGNMDVLKQLAESALQEPGIQGVGVFDAAGMPLASSGTPVPGISKQPVVDLVADRESLVFTVPIGQIQTAPDDTLMPGGATTPPPGKRALGFVQVRISRAPLAQRKQELIVSATLIALLGLVAALWGARVLAHSVMRPVQVLARVVGEIGRGNLSVRAPARSAGALRDLELGVNDMARSLEDARATLEQRIAVATAALQVEKERAESANRAKTQFLAAASHDLRQPLQALGLLVSALRMRAQDTGARDLAGRVEHALNGLEGVLEALLDISKLDAGAVSPQVQVFPVQRVLENVRDTFLPHAQAKNLELRVATTRAWVTSDPLLLERIISNLVSNAIRYTDKGGVLIGVRPRGMNVHVQVWDTGRGIPEDKQAEVFREFVQLDNPSRDRRQGIGLGLAIVDRLSRLLEHPIVLRSRVGKGTVFEVHVPRGARYVEPVMAPRVDPTGPSTLAGMTVLLLDDDTEVLAALEQYLRLVGAEVIAVENLEEAIKRFMGGQREPDIIVSDYRLGAGVDGVTAVAELNRRFGPRPAMILTGEAAPAVLRAIEASGLPRLSKPIRPAVLRATLRELADRRRLGGTRPPS
jgi:signal transduction histidine kinase/ActR/RegA family two-component response regulator